MGFFKSLKRGFTEANHQRLFEINSQKITLNFSRFASGQSDYGMLISNVSYLLSEQIKYTVIPSLDEYKLNRISINLGFWLIVFIHVAKVKNEKSKHRSISSLEELVEIEKQNQESFKEFYSSVKDDYLKDFIDNNPTTNNLGHFEKILENKYSEYIEDPLHIKRFIEDRNSFHFNDKASRKLRNDLYNSMQDAFGIRIMPEDLEYIANLFYQLFNTIDQSFRTRQT